MVSLAYTLNQDHKNDMLILENMNLEFFSEVSKATPPSYRKVNQKNKHKNVRYITILSPMVRRRQEVSGKR